MLRICQLLIKMGTPASLEALWIWVHMSVGQKVLKMDLPSRLVILMEMATMIWLG